MKESLASSAYLFIVYVLDVLHLGSAAITNYEMELDKLNSYMRYKKLSLATQKRIISYYDYKFERMYLDEKGLASAVAGKNITLVSSEHSN